MDYNYTFSTNHARNYVQLNGEWYAMDVTWDDPKINSTGTSDNQVHHSYFLKGVNNTKFMNSHILDEDFEVPTFFDLIK